MAEVSESVKAIMCCVRAMSFKFRFALCYLLLALAGLSADAAQEQSEATPSASGRVKVSEGVAASLVAEKAPLKYPDVARNAGIQGTVVLKVVVAKTGEVEDVSVVSGDSVLGQAAAGAVKQWKYKPYRVGGAPVEMETQVSINFHLKSLEHTAPPLGTFGDDTYSNEFFDLNYPMSRDWVRETEAMRKRVAEGGSLGLYVLLAAVHIPQQTAPLEADSSFVFSALDGAGRNCEQHLQGLADDLHSRKQAKGKGSVTALMIAGRNFRRVDFDFGESPGHRTFLCMESKDYLLLWNIAGLSKGAVESTVSTLNAIQSASLPSSPAISVENAANSNASAGKGNKAQVANVKVAPGISQGLLIKKVQPVYPLQARYARIQGTVRMSAVINKAGDVIDLEVLDGPIELVVSAVNAVRQWKYRPYLFNGDPVQVRTVIIVNYALSGV